MSAIATEHGTPVVLVVEDNDAARQLRVEALQEAGCIPLPASSHAEALRALEEGPHVDLVLTDVNLARFRADKSGVTLARHVKRHHAGVFVVGYSSFFAEEQLAGEMDAFDRFMPRPVPDYRAFLEAIEEFRALATEGWRARTAAEASAASISHLTERVDRLTRLVERIQATMVTRDRVVLMVIKVLALLIGAATALIEIFAALKPPGH